jgi:hypothetical protein
MVEDMSSKVALPVLAGIEARIAMRKGTRLRRPTEKAALTAAESSAASSASSAAVPAPESSKIFATRMKGRFVLRGPRSPAEPAEGGNTGKDNEQTNATEEDTSRTIAPAAGSLLSQISQAYKE